MKHTNSTLNLLSASIMLVGSANAAFINDDFESYSPVLSDMNGQGGWIVNNGISAGDPVAIVDSYTWDGSSRSATLGELEPDVPGLVTLSRSASVSAGLPSSFSIEVAYAESTNVFRNNFSIALGSSAGNLIEIYLKPSLTLGVYDVSYGGLIVTDPSGVAFLGTLNELTGNMVDPSTQFQLDTYFDGTNVNYSFSNAGAPVKSGMFATVTASDMINNVSVSWDSGSNGGPGDNFITVDNVKLNTVPEPGSTFLLLAGSVVGLGLLRRTGKVVKQEI